VHFVQFVVMYGDCTAFRRAELKLNAKEWLGNANATAG
jgi:hypothetical protein